MNHFKSILLTPSFQATQIRFPGVGVAADVAKPPPSGDQQLHQPAHLLHVERSVQEGRGQHGAEGKVEEEEEEGLSETAGR